MGIDIHSARFLQSESKRGLSFGQTLTLGHQVVYMDGDSYRSFDCIAGEFPAKKLFLPTIYSAAWVQSPWM